ncbi:MAG: hypothetical protein N2201_04965 [candidate division WOR-3 bacterium]|nr:hypothetical protein [candidate division WOR-3 bacterium]
MNICVCPIKTFLAFIVIIISILIAIIWALIGYLQDKRQKSKEN